MSIEATLATWKLTKQQVTPTEKIFLLSCANRAGEHHECWPSLKRLIADTGLDRKTIIKIRQSTIDKGLMEYTGSYVGHSHQIPIMRLTYVEKLPDNLEVILTSTNIGTSTTFGMGTSTKIGTGTSTTFGTLNLKEETKILNNKYIYAEDDFPELETGKPEPDVYTEFDELMEKSDKEVNHAKQDEGIAKDIVTTRGSVKSDYFDNRPINKADRKKKEVYELKDILNENIHQIPEQMISDWMINRKNKRAPITKTVWNKINKELAKCKEGGIDPMEAFETMVAGGWHTFLAEWFLKDKKQTPPMKYIPKEQRPAEYEKIAAREKQAHERKQEEIEAAKNLKGIVEIAKTKMSFAMAQKQADEEIKKLGISANDYHAHTLKQIINADCSRV